MTKNVGQFLISLIFIPLLAYNPVSGLLSVAGDNLPVKAEKPAISEIKPYNKVLEDWIWALGKCESGNNQNAYNPKDLDNTPSIGKYQFKTQTFRHFVQKYDMFNWQEWEDSDWTNNLWNGSAQEEVLRKMIEDPEVDF